MRFATLPVLLLAACSRFVWHEDPFTPDAAPASEFIATGRDTTYVLRGTSYYLLTPQRAALWNREVVDDVAWRYRSLFSEAPPLIAIRLDTVRSMRDSTTWRGVPVATVVLPQHSDSTGSDRRHPENVERDSANARLFARPLLAATAAEAWLRARVMDASRATDGEPGGPEPAVSAGGSTPAWFEAGALRLLASPGAAYRATAEVIADSKGVLPLATLFAVQWPDKPNGREFVALGRAIADLGGNVMSGRVERARPHRDRVGVPGVAPLFISQATSVLAFIRERDPVLVARLADQLPRGRTMGDLLAMSTGLPHDIAGLEAEWKTWVKRIARRR